MWEKRSWGLVMQAVPVIPRRQRLAAEHRRQVSESSVTMISERFTVFPVGSDLEEEIADNGTLRP